MFLFFNNSRGRTGLVGTIAALLLNILMNCTSMAVVGTALLADNIAPGGGSLDALPDEHAGFAVVVDQQGNAFLAGTSSIQWGSPVRSHSGGAGDCFVAKVSDQGFLQWHTFLGSSRFDSCHAIALDADGNVYVTGESGSTWAEPRRAYEGGSYDGFVAKLNSKGVLQWHTFLGGAFNDGGYALTVDRNQNVFVAGNSVETWGDPVKEHSGSTHDGFAAGLDKDGQLLWNTFFGGEDYDAGYAIALDAEGNVYVAGESFSGWGSPVNGFVRGYYGEFDAFVVKFDKEGRLQWNTFLGGTGTDYGRGIAVDMSGNIYVTGESNTSWGKPLSPHHGSYDAFAAKLDSNGRLQWNTFLGGKGADYSRSVTAPWTDNIFITGQSSLSWGTPLHKFSGGDDIFAAKIDTDGNLQWNTFLGGTGSDFGRSITMDGIGNVYLTGERSSDRGDSGETFQERKNTFVAKLNNAGHLRWKILLGQR